LGLIADIIAYVIASAIVSKSPAYGEQCCACLARGKITDRRLGKNFIGSMERDGVTYNRYSVTYLRTCQMCGKDWPSVIEEESQSNNPLDALKGFRGC
jgi:hypothetical protein